MYYNPFLFVIFFFYSSACLGQNSVFNFNFHHKNTAEFLDFGLNSYPTPQPKKGIFRFDSLYLLYYKDTSNAFISASPLLHVSLGRGRSSQEKLRQNSRGILVQGGFRHFTCFLILMENQAFFPQYQNHFIQSHGEFYPSANSYNQQNGMIPGAARTKPFKTMGFDYAYSYGGLTWKISEHVKVFGGNPSVRLGDGPRSLCWSSHNQATQLGLALNFTENLQYTISKAKLFDLIRKPAYANVESPYFKKALAMNALLFTKKAFRLGLLYQTVWGGGDSIKEKKINPWFWSPLPGPDLFVKKETSLPQWGLLAKFNLRHNVQLYSEVFCRGTNRNAMSYQIGVNYQSQPKNPVRINVDVSFQSVGLTFYGENYQNSFSHNNLPLGSLTGNGTKDLLLLAKFVYKRLYLDVLFQYYQFQGGKSILFRDAYIPEKKVVHGIGELGFLLNPISQLVIFSSLDARVTSSNSLKTYFTLGIKTALFQNYNVY